MQDTKKANEWQNIQLKPNLKEGEDYMIVDDELFNFWFINYRVDRDITRYGIIVNEETEECIVEIYLK